jgi:hypothetical protein
MPVKEKEEDFVVYTECFCCDVETNFHLFLLSLTVASGWFTCYLLVISQHHDKVPINEGIFSSDNHLIIFYRDELFVMVVNTLQGNLIVGRPKKEPHKLQVHIY